MSYNLSVFIHWTGLLDWTAGLDYWTHPNCNKNTFVQCRTEAHSACYFPEVAPLACGGIVCGWDVFPWVCWGQKSRAYL